MYMRALHTCIGITLTGSTLTGSFWHEILLRTVSPELFWPLIVLDLCHALYYCMSWSRSTLFFYVRHTVVMWLCSHFAVQAWEYSILMHIYNIYISLVEFTALFLCVKVQCMYMYMNMPSYMFSMLDYMHGTRDMSITHASCFSLYTCTYCIFTF